MVNTDRGIVLNMVYVTRQNNRFRLLDDFYAF